MARCPDCNKFVPFDTEVEPEEESTEYKVEVDGAIEVEADYTRTLNCGECGTELRTTSLNVQGTLKLYVPDGTEDADGSMQMRIEDCQHDDDDHPLEVTFTADATERAEGKGWTKKYYGIVVHVDAKCGKCGGVASGTLEAEEASSAFDEC